MGNGHGDSKDCSPTAEPQVTHNRKASPGDDISRNRTYYDLQSRKHCWYGDGERLRGRRTDGQASGITADRQTQGTVTLTARISVVKKENTCDMCAVSLPPLFSVCLW